MEPKDTILNIAKQRVKSHHIFQEDSTNDFFITFPHIYQRIKKIWGSAMCRKYIMELITDTRDDSREGFKPSHISTLIKLLDKHDLECPQYIIDRGEDTPFQS